MGSFRGGPDRRERRSGCALNDAACEAFLRGAHCGVRHAAARRASVRAMLAILDGTVTDAAHAQIPATDDGFLRGDGVFEVMRLYGGRLFAPGDHPTRLGGAAAHPRPPPPPRNRRAPPPTPGGGDHPPGAA